jgi:hypothetical protein
MHNTLFSINTPRNKIDSADFIGFVKPLHGDNEQHDKLMSNLPKQKPYFTENQQKSTNRV